MLVSYLLIRLTACLLIGSPACLLIGSPACLLSCLLDCAALVSSRNPTCPVIAFLDIRGSVSLTCGGWSTSILASVRRRHGCAFPSL